MAARNPIDAIIELGANLAVAASKAARIDSLDQACRETEARLASLRDQESKVGAGLTDAQAEYDRKLANLETSYRHSADALKARHDATAARGAEAIAASEAETAGKLADLDEQVSSRKARVLDLEQEESKLGQSIASLRSDLAAIRAKLG